MRAQGTLNKWNDERGFGFISTLDMGQELFVHISQFPQDGVRPQLGELLTFEIQLDARGRKSAVRVLRACAVRPRPAQQPGYRSSAQQHGRGSSGLLRRLVPALVIAGVVFLGHAAFNGMRPRTERAGQFDGSLPVALPMTAPIAAQPSFQCDGREHCSQMRSYQEALFFLRNCPGVKMDGDGDGRPCEQQF